MTREELVILQSLPLNIKILKTKQRIIEAIDTFGSNNLYVSNSGGKDSAVLKHLCEELVFEINVDRIKTVYLKTGLEWESVDEQGMKSDVVLKPSMSFVEVIKKYGYPAPSKEQAQFIRQFRTHKSEKTKNTRLNGNEWGRGKISTKWLPLIRSDFMVSEQCCDIMKKKPFKKYEKKTGEVPLIATMAYESQLRTQGYLKNGCNAFELTRPKSTPMGFWTEQDILKYIKDNNVEIASIYGEVMEVDFFGTLKLTGESRTGCVFCMFGCDRDNFEKFETLKKIEPKKYDYCMRGGSVQDGLWKPDGGLGMAKVIKFLKSII